MNSIVRLRVLALIHPLERHVGHWASSSPSLSIQRVLMEGAELEGRISQTVAKFRPHVIAVTSKSSLQYLDLLDRLATQVPELRTIPRIFRCQNTMLSQRFGPRAEDPALCHAESGWFRIACDPRWSLILVQTLDDIELIRRHLAPTLVAACPYGYDQALFNPDLPELAREVDVGCYMNLKGIPARAALVEAAQQICSRHGYAFHFESGVYGHTYADMIRATKIHLHWSEHGEVPYRMYETTALAAVFLSNPLGCGVERLFTLGEEYLTYQEDLSDLERIIVGLMEERHLRNSIAGAGQARARQYAWPSIAEAYVVPALRELTVCAAAGEAT